MKRKLNKKFFGLLFFGFLVPLVFVHGQSISETIGAVGTSSGLPSNDATSLLVTTMLWLLQIFTFLAILAFIIAGIMFLLSGSNSKMAEQAKAAVGYSIIGIVVALSAYIIILLIDDLLWGTAGNSGTGDYFIF